MWAWNLLYSDVTRLRHVCGLPTINHEPWRRQLNDKCSPAHLLVSVYIYVFLWIECIPRVLQHCTFVYRDLFVGSKAYVRLRIHYVSKRKKKKYRNIPTPDSPGLHILSAPRALHPRKEHQAIDPSLSLSLSLCVYGSNPTIPNRILQSQTSGLLFHRESCLEKEINHMHTLDTHVEREREGEAQEKRSEEGK